jgi:hypothetical protein
MDGSAGSGEPLCRKSEYFSHGAGLARMVVPRFRLTAPSAGGNESSVVSQLDGFSDSSEPLHNAIAREFERLFGRIVKTEQDLARTYLVILMELSQQADQMLLYSRGE